jgi:DNA end-binding protein Ku
MRKLNRCGIATVVLHGKEQLLMIRPIDGLLAMVMLRYQNEIRDSSSVTDAAGEMKIGNQELKLAQQLIESATATKFDFSQYENHYTDRLKELIEAKIAGQEIIEPPQTEDEVPIINLMDALRKSVQKSKQSPKAKQARKALASRLAGGSQTRPRRRKSS